MGMRSVRLDDEAEKLLARLRRTTGLSITKILHEGLRALDATAERHCRSKPYDIWCRLDLGEGGDAVAPARAAKAAAREAIRRKHRR